MCILGLGATWALGWWWAGPGLGPSRPFLLVFDVLHSPQEFIPKFHHRQLLVFINAHRKFRKRMDTVIAFTGKYSKVSYLSIGKQWLKRLIIHHHVSTNLIYQLD
jgi:hypothetical protein